MAQVGMDRIAENLSKKVGEQAYEIAALQAYGKVLEEELESLRARLGIKSDTEAAREALALNEKTTGEQPKERT